MRLSIRTKLFAIVATAAAGFLILLVTNVALSNRVSRELNRIEAVYIPKVETGPSLERRFEDIARGFQDAVAVRDPEALAANATRKEELVKELGAARPVLDGKKVDELLAAIEDYHATAAAVSTRLIAGETGEALVDAIVSMQKKQRHAGDLLTQTTRFDRSQLSDAFGAANRAQRTAFKIRVGVILVCLTAVVGLSFWLVGDLVRSVRELTEGFERFGAGKLEAPIEITTNDELAAVARHANRMADSLRRTVGDLEAFNYSVSHDLRAPLRPLDGFSQALIEDYSAQLDPKAKDYLNRIRAAAQRMSQLIDDMLQLSRLGRAEMRAGACDLVPIAKSIVEEISRNEPERKVELVTPPEARAECDSRLVRIVLENLLRNAWKFSRKNPNARIELGTRQEGGETIYFVRDNGAGFDPTYTHKLFQPFQRLHSVKEFEGTGIGLAIVQRIIRRHEGRVWAESTPGAGATFFFTLYEGKGAR